MNYKTETLHSKQLIEYFNSENNNGYIPYTIFSSSNGTIPFRVIKNLQWQTWKPNFNNYIELIPVDGKDSIKIVNTTGSYRTPLDVWYKGLIISNNDTTKNSNFTYEYSDVVDYIKENDSFYQKIQEIPIPPKTYMHTFVYEAKYYNVNIVTLLPKTTKILAILIEGPSKNGIDIDGIPFDISDGIPRYFKDYDFKEIKLSEGARVTLYCETEGEKINNVI